VPLLNKEDIENDQDACCNAFEASSHFKNNLQNEFDEVREKGSLLLLGL